MNDRRWDVDEQGHGVADASALASGVHELAGMLAVEDWVAEEPEAHLLPHIRRACDELGAELLGHELDGAVFAVRVAAPDNLSDRHAAAFHIVGSFAEPATSVRIRGRDSSYEVITGFVDGDSHFKSHGHMVRIEFVPSE